MAVDTDRHHADGESLVFNDDRHCRRGHVGGVGTEQQIDFVDIDELVVDAGHVRRIALVVIKNQINRAAQEAALRVDVIAPHLQREQQLLAVLRHPAGECHAETDLDRIGRHRRRGEEQNSGSGKSCAPNGQRGRSSRTFSLPPDAATSQCIISSPGITPHKLEAEGSFSQTFGRCGLSRCQGRGSK